MEQKTNTIHLAWDQSGRRTLKSVCQNLFKVVLLFVLTVALSELLRAIDLDRQVITMVYILSVLIASRITAGYGYGILAAISLSLVYNYLNTYPRMDFGFRAEFPLTLFIMLLITLITSAMTAQSKEQAETAIERAEETELLYEISQKILAAHDLESMIQTTNTFLLEHIGRSVVFYTADPLSEDSSIFTQSPRESGAKKQVLSKAERTRAHRIYISPGRSDLLSLSDGTVHYEPVVSKEKVFGLIGVYRAKKPLGESCVLFLRAVTAQLALALETLFLFEEQNNILLDAEREKTRASLLRAISHDLRTPLTSILGASTTMLEREGELDKEMGKTLLEDIRETAQWLIHTAENLLTITKLSGETIHLKKTLEAAEEVVAGSVSIVRRRFPGCHIHMRSPQNLLFVPMAATLVSQVLINLIENSIKNSDKESLILVDVSSHEGFAKFSVSDTGRGIPEEMLDTLFEMRSNTDKHAVDSVQGAVDSVQGMGIGLSICKTIVHAHGGTITGKNKPDGGAHFSFSLPLEENTHGKT